MNKKLTIVVLPFINLSSNKDNEYFSDGITEEIISALSKLDEINIISRTSSFYFKNKVVPMSEIAELLNVNIAIVGSVRMSGDKVRISSQIINAIDDTHIWSNSWDRNLDNIFEIQDEISIQIAEKLRENIGHIEIVEHLVKAQTDSIDTYKLSLEARYYFNRWNPADVEKSIDLYSQALKLDSQHLESHIGIADAYSFLGTTGFMDAQVAWTKTVEHTNIALELDSNNPKVYYLLANISFFLNCDFVSTFKHAYKSINIKKNYPEGQQFMSFLYTLIGDMENALKHLNYALDLDPLNQETLFYKAFYNYRIGNHDNSISILDELLNDNPKNIPALTVKAYNLLCMQDTKRALQLINELPEEITIIDDILGIECLSYIVDRKKEKSENLLSKLEEKARHSSAIQAHSYLFLSYIFLNRFDDAFHLLEKSLSNQSPIFLISYSDPLAKKLRNDNRYYQFEEKIYPDISFIIEVKDSKPELLDETTSQAIIKKLVEFVEQESPFLNPDLSLRSLADLLEIHPNHLSWILNKKINKNFNEFINHYRISHFKTLALDSSNSHISLIGLAFESGFNSKTTFNTYFKKETGMTPSQFIKSQT